MIHTPYWQKRIPLLNLLHPHEQTMAVMLSVVVGLALGILGMWLLKVPLWGAAALMIGVLLIPGYAKWYADQRRYGTTTMILSILLTAQGFHAIEHIVQWVQNHVLHWSTRASNGLLSPANAEWVHFVWNWLVLLVVIRLIYGGMRNPWAWLLLAWTTAHTFEHSYMFVRYLMVLSDLRAMGITNLTAQGLPGILGQDGWLMRSEVTRGSFICSLPGLTTATRLDVHFWWNMGETALLLFAGNTFLQSKQIYGVERWQKSP